MRKRLVLFMLAAFLVIPGAAGATSYTLDTGGLSFTDNGKLYADFSIVSNPLGVNSALITVTPDLVINSFDNLTYNILRFTTSEFSASSGDSKDFTLQYSVTATDGALINMIDQGFVLSAAGDGGFVTIGEKVAAGGFGGAVVAHSSVSFSIFGDDSSDPPGEFLQGDNLIFAPQQKVYIIKDIQLDPDAEGVVSASTLVQSFHQTAVPEPATMLLLGFGLIGLVGVSRKFKK